jgi:hypothetical protein
MSILASVFSSSEKVRAQVESSRDTQLFLLNLETILSQTTLVGDCNCNPTGAAPFCDNDTMAPGNYAGAATVFKFVAERVERGGVWNASGPASKADCINPPFVAGIVGAIEGTGTGALTYPIMRQGCKINYILRYTPPVNEAGITPSTAGTLALIRLSPANTETVEASIEGIDQFACGMSRVSSGPPVKLSNTDFKIQFRRKARISKAPFGTREYESWHSSGQNFNRGYLRNYSLSVAFRNLTVSGVHFLSLKRTRNCVNDYELADSANQCCSTYWDAGTCLPANTCGTAEQIGIGVDQCCSHMLSADGTVCL